MFFNLFFRSGKHKCHICQEAFYQKDMLKRHVLSLHNEVTSFRGRGKTSQIPKSSNKAGYKRTMDCPNPLKYNPNVTLTPGTLMTVFKCPIDSCGKKSCTDIKSFKLHCMHIHQVQCVSPKHAIFSLNWMLHPVHLYDILIIQGVVILK